MKPSIVFGVDLATSDVKCACIRISRQSLDGAPITEIGRVDSDLLNGHPLPMDLIDVFRNISFKNVEIGGYRVTVDTDLSKLRIVFA